MIEGEVKFTRSFWLVFLNNFTLCFVKRFYNNQEPEAKF